MSDRRISDKELMAYMDGEAGDKAESIAALLKQSPADQEALNDMREKGAFLRERMNSAMEDVQPLHALTKIRERITQDEEARLGAWLKRWFDDLWLWHRKALAAGAFAMALGALTAPALVWMVKKMPADSRMNLAFVEFELLEYEGDVAPVIHHADNGAMTLIWIEPEADVWNEHDNTY